MTNMANKNVELMVSDPETAIRKLAVPTMISVLLTASFDFIDGIWVVGIGPDAIAGIGFIHPLYMILMGVAMGIGAGATSSISRFIGAKNHEGANSSALHSIVILLIASILLTVILLLFLKPALILFGASGGALQEALKYGTPLFLGLTGFMFANGAIGILRGEGDMKRSMYAMAITTVLNAILDPIFIYTLNFGSAGAAYSTVVSFSIPAIIIMYWILIKKDTYVDVNLKNYKYDSEIVYDILKVGIPASINMILMAASVSIHLIFISIISGAYGIAVMSSSFKLYSFAILPITAIGTAVTSVSGSAFGAKNGDYLSRSHLYGCKISFIIGIIIIAIFYLFATPLATIFAYTPETSSLIPGIVEYCYIISLSVPFIAIGIISDSFYQGVGKGLLSLIWTLIRELIFSSILIYVFGILLGWGLFGVWAGIALGKALIDIINFIYARHLVNKLTQKMNN